MKRVSSAFGGGVALFLVGIIVILTGCSGSGDESDGGTPAVLAGIEIDATAIYYEQDNETGVQVSVWNEGYTSPVEDAVVAVNGVALTYSAGFEMYTHTFSTIAPGDDVAFTITINEETYSKTLAMPGQFTFITWSGGAEFDTTIGNIVEWTYGGGAAPATVTIMVGNPEKYRTDISGGNLSYTIPANTFDGTEAYAYVGARAVNSYDDPDNRKHFEAFTSDEFFCMNFK